MPSHRVRRRGLQRGLEVRRRGGVPRRCRSEHLQGRKIVVVAVYEDRPRVDMALVNDRELSLVGTLMYQQADYRQAVEWLSDGTVQVAPLISRHFPFAEYAEAYRFIDQNGPSTLKVIIDL